MTTIKNISRRAKIAKKVTTTGLVVNILLSTLKLVASYLGRSRALMADAIHSLSDVASDVVVLICIHLAGKEEDEDHQYGHGKFETLATLIVAVVLFIAAIFIFLNGVKAIIAVLYGEGIREPKIIALWAALISIVVKELLFRYSVYHAKKIESDALMANGWHHRTDALSSIGVFIGVAGALFLGPKWVILDPIAGLFVALLIGRVAYQLVRPALGELMDEALPPLYLEKIEGILNGHPDIISYHKLRTRKVGRTHIVDIHIELSKELTFVRSHDIATDIEKQLEELFRKECIIMIHTEPI